MARADISEFLDALSLLPEGAPSISALQIDGFLLRGNAGTVRVIAGDLALEFSIDDVIEIVEIEQAADAGFGLAVPVQLRLRHAARLLCVSPAAVYFPLLEKQNAPFAYAARKSFPPMQPAPRFRSLEDAFRKKHGLE